MTEKKPTLKQAFAAFKTQDENLRKARELVEEAQLSRSDAIAVIAEHYGTGPYDYDGQLLTIVKRQPTEEKDGQKVPVGEPTYFFKATGGQVTKV